MIAPELLLVQPKTVTIPIYQGKRYRKDLIRWWQFMHLQNWSNDGVLDQGFSHGIES